ncbi:uncharacterized protein HMPREF1541_04017 [Cyphellophora europaea CBS 101466]|uniref:TATA element modulatory factor 1 TATA binding domain-containing protein n=1 Tax=Cyphellophora europaea (strain CBS 101466) TaxID=1220924 RepID=W2S201_CYPE1|nr:uncharacterized protein HMPREF1541_04017 [Cyphellophora europaea CBS 101466]ETN42078.1 hypothetical protein HMPREF1541_04017 [Cyphellophora europaea CBS 101466]
MASQKQQQKANRWGFLSQAVASVEAGLDTILAEDEAAPKRTAPVATKQAKDTPSSTRPSAELPRSGASTPGNDRLQARLAKAMAQKNQGRSESPAPTSTMDPQPENASVEQKASEEIGRGGKGPTDEVEETNVGGPQMSENPTVGEPSDATKDSTEPVIEERTKSTPSQTALDAPTSQADSLRPSTEAALNSTISSSVRASTESVNKADPALLHSQLEAEASRQKLQEELNDHIERIDGLQAKLKYLSAQAAKSAKDAAVAAEAGSTEKQILEKDEKIALLMQEGTTLQKTELTLRQTVKKLRQQTASTEKASSDNKQRAERAERNLRIVEDRARKAEAVAKRAEQNLASSAHATSGLEAVTKERDALNATLADIRTQLSRANARADAAESKATAEQLEKERKKTADLQDDITSAKVERELAEEKLKREIKDLKASLEREKAHSRAMETEMLGEQAALESKLESFRARAEEASSSDQGGVQAKLLRQIETLQSQYAAASQNWQGIEGSLLIRITNLEKERDEVAARESDVRRKLRETTSKLKRAERDLEDAQNRLPETEKLLGEAEEEGQRLSAKIKHLDGEVAQARKDLDEQKAQAERDTVRRIEEERAKWTASLQTQRIESPMSSFRKASGLALDVSDRPTSRRSSVFPDIPLRQQSHASLKGLSNGGMLETPSIVTSQDPDEYFNNVPPTPASQGHGNSPRALHDLVSTSTVGAGPSVQLVERMSANVRRLESEKAASKDEIARLTSQRDGSRSEVVNLMREVEEKRNVAERLKTLEEEYKALSDRYSTTLELLGEKSELVEELKADILDVKQMYRQLADTMGK